MKSIYRFLFAVFCLYTVTIPLNAQWIPTNLTHDRSVRSLLSYGTNLIAGTNSGVFVSTDNGINWPEASTGLANESFTSFAVYGTNLFAGTYGGGVFLSTDNGTSWDTVNNGLSNWKVLSLVVSGNNLFAGTEYSEVFRSTDNGANWMPASSGIPSFTMVNCFVVSDTNLFAGTDRGIFRSTNNGIYWTAPSTDLAGMFVYCLAVNGTNLFAGTWDDGAFISTNNGISWARIDTGWNIYSLAVSGTNLFVGSSHGIFLSTNNGTSWTDAGLPSDAMVWSLAISGTNLFAATENNLDPVWRRALSEMVTSVENPLTDLPTQFSLAQNYPNPFNPATTISLNLPGKSFVSLKVFDVIGREVATLLNEQKPAGTYTLQWNAANMPSGVYFYRLQAGNFTETKKLVLLK